MSSKKWNLRLELDLEKWGKEWEELSRFRGGHDISKSGVVVRKVFWGWHIIVAGVDSPGGKNERGICRGQLRPVWGVLRGRPRHLAASCGFLEL